MECHLEGTASDSQEALDMYLLLCFLPSELRGHKGDSSLPWPFICVIIITVTVTNTTTTIILGLSDLFYLLFVIFSNLCRTAKEIITCPMTIP